GSVAGGIKTPRFRNGRAPIGCATDARLAYRDAVLRTTVVIGGEQAVTSMPSIVESNGFRSSLTASRPDSAAVIVRASGRSSTPQRINGELTTSHFIGGDYWIARWSLHSDGAKRRSGCGQRRSKASAAPRGPSPPWFPAKPPPRPP